MQTEWIRTGKNKRQDIKGKKLKRKEEKEKEKWKEGKKR
jgi:hypothetical protein